MRPCFNTPYYLERYPDVRQSGVDPLAHFLLYGGTEGRQPDPLFDSEYYLAAYPDVAAAGSNPLVHFLRFGWKEGRRPNPLFDPAFYAANCPQPLGKNRNPFVDYVVRRRKGETPKAWLPFALPHGGYQVATITPARNLIIDIVIPVHSGLMETRECLESLLDAECQTAYNIVLVNDHSPDPELGRYLQEMTVAHGFTLIENSTNRGFAASVNRGLALHPDRDVVLLNNDTKVANDWLDRLAAAAVERTGTVTPFSNNGTLCSYPKLDVENRLPEGLTVGDLDGVFRRVNAGHRVPIPTAVGFCMYIRRECLNEVGTLRAEIFGKGYGEENDFCLRAINKGWSHVLAADVFVYHAGETSFGAEAETRRKAGMQTLEHLYPAYNRMISEHLRNDPAKPYRIAVSAWRMRQSGKPVILHVSHRLGGGIEQYVSALRETLAGDAEMLLLTPTSSGAVILRNLDPRDDFSVAFDHETDYPALLDLLRHCGVTRLHIQHLLGHKLDVIRLKHDLSVALDFSVHDYYVLCPQVTLTDVGGWYCGEPDSTGCNACLAIRPPWPPTDIGAWRERYAPVVANADRVIAPSRDAADRLRRYFPEAKIVAAAHPGTRVTMESPSPRPLAPDQPLVIAVLGAMTHHKGIHRLRAAASEARRQNLPLQFVLLGYVDKLLAGKAEPFVQTGPYNNDELPGLLRRVGAQVAWFPAQWPETFSYTLSACFEMGLPVIVPDLGAFPERVAGRSWSWIVPWDQDISRMLEFFLAVRQDHFVTGLAPPVPAGNRKVAADGFYPVEYLS